MAAITEAQSNLYRRMLYPTRKLMTSIPGMSLMLKNFDATTGALAVSVGAALTGTTAAAFEIDTDGSVPALALGSQAAGSGDYTLTIKPATTLTGNADVIVPDGADTFCMIGATQTLTGKTLTSPVLTTPTIADFTNATHTHATAAQGGALSLPSLSGTSAITFTINTDGAAAKLAFSSNAATGAFTTTVVTPNITGNTTITLPNATSTIAALSVAQTWTAAQTIGTSGSIAGSGTGSFNMSGASGVFTTSTGENTLSGNVTISGTNTFATGTGTVGLNGDVTVAANKDLVLADGTGYIYVGGATTGGIKIIAVSGGTSDLTLTNPSCAAATTITLPNATCTLAGSTMNNNFTATQTVAVDSSATNSVTDVLTLRSSSTGTAAAGIGVGLAFQVEDSDAASTEQGSIDVSLADVGTAGATVDADMVFSLRLAGTVTQVMKIDSVNECVIIGSNASNTDGINSLKIYPQTASSGSLILLAAVDASGDHSTTITNSTAAASSITITLPAVTSTLAVLGANTFTGAQTFGAGILASGAVANDFSGGSGTFLTSTGANTLSGSTTAISGAVTMATTKGITFGSASNGTATPLTMYSLTEANGSIVIAVANNTNNAAITITNGSNASASTITLPPATCTLSGIGLAETFSAVKTFTAAPVVTLDDETDGIVNGLTLTHSSSNNAATFADGIGISFKLENNANTVEEWASIDVASQVIDDGTEGGSLQFNLMNYGTVGRAMLLSTNDQSLTIGQSTTNGYNFDKLRIYGLTESKGSLVIQSVANTTNTDVTIKNAAHGQATTLTIPDCANAAASFVLTYGNATLNGAITLSGTNATALTLSGTNATAGITLSGTIGKGIYMTGPNVTQGIVIGTEEFGAAGTGIVVDGDTLHSGCEFYFDDGGVKLAAGYTEAFRCGYLVSTAITDADVSLYTAHDYVYLAASVTTSGGVGATWASLLAATGAVLTTSTGLCDFSAFNASCDVPSGATIGTGTFVAGISMGGNLGGTHTGKAVAFRVRTPSAGAWDGVFDMPTAMKSDTVGAGALVYIPIYIGGVAAKLVANYVAA